MTAPRKRFWYGLVAAVLLGLVIRLALVAWQLETAPSALAALAQNATLGWLGYGYKPLVDRSGREQAEFWLAETDRILKQDPTPEMTLAAAWVLNSLAAPQEFEPKWLAAERAAFEQLCGRRSAELALEAARRMGDDHRAWQAFAQLVFASDIAGQTAPRIESWEQALEEAAEHDPENSLYDYSIASQLLHESTVVERPAGRPQLRILDAERYERAIQHSQRGSEREFVQRAHYDGDLVARFLSRSKLSSREWAEVLYDRSTVTVFDHLSRMLSWRMNEVYQPPESVKRSLEYAELGWRPVNAIGQHDFMLSSYLIMTRNNSLETALQRISSSKLLLTPDDWSEIEARLAATYARLEDAETATEDGLLLLDANPWAFWQADWRPVFRTVVLDFAGPYALLLAVTALAAWAITKLKRGSKEHPRGLGIVAHFIVWVTLVTASFVFFGLVPAGRVGTSAMQSVGHVLAVAIPAVLGAIVLGAIFLLLRKRSRGLLLLILIPILGLLVTGLQTARFKLLVPDGDTYVKAFQANDVRPSLMDAYRRDSRYQWYNTIRWAAVQWSMYRGAWVLALAPAVVAFWSWRRSKSMATAGRDTARTCLVAAMLLLILFLVVVPGELEDIQTQLDKRQAVNADWEAVTRRFEFIARFSDIDPAEQEARELKARERAAKDVELYLPNAP